MGYQRSPIHATFLAFGTVISEMPAILVPLPIPPAAEAGCSPSDNKGNGVGGGPVDPGYRPSENFQAGSAAPLSAYRLVTILAIIWIATLFVTLTCVLLSRWAHSPDWFSIPLPSILYVNTAILLLSSLSIEFARFSLRAGVSKHCARWIFVTLILGVVFIGGQIVAWRALVFRGLHLASNPGSFFLYLITGAHALHFLVAIISLASVRFLMGRLTRKAEQQTALGTIALYWHFMDGLWCYLLALLFFTIQR